MVFVQNLTSPADIQDVLGGLAPGQFHQPVEVGPEHVGFRGVGMHLFKPSQLLESLFLDSCRHLGLFDGCAKLCHFLGPGVRFAQFLLYGTELFAQEIFSLGFPHFLLRGRLDASLHGEELYFLVEMFVYLFQTFDRIDGFQEFLGLLDFQPDIACNEVGETSGVLHVFQDHRHFRGDVFPQRGDPRNLFLDGSQECFRLKGRVGYSRFFYAFDAYGEEWFRIDEFRYFPLGQPLDQDFHPAVRKLEHAHDHGNRTDGIDRIRCRFLFRYVLLGREENEPVSGQCPVDCADGDFAADKKRNDHVGVNHNVAHGEQGENVGYFQLFFFRGVFHGHSPLLRIGYRNRLLSYLLSGNHFCPFCQVYTTSSSFPIKRIRTCPPQQGEAEPSCPPATSVLGELLRCDLPFVERSDACALRVKHDDCRAPCPPVIRRIRGIWLKNS